MRPQGFDGVELAFESFFGEQRVNVVVTRSAKPGDAPFHFAALEFALSFFVRVARARNQMMAGDVADFPSAKFTTLKMMHGKPDIPPRGLRRVNQSVNPPPPNKRVSSWYRPIRVARAVSCPWRANFELNIPGPFTMS
jgi:hypothetical protein